MFIRPDKLLDNRSVHSPIVEGEENNSWNACLHLLNSNTLQLFDEKSDIAREEVCHIPILLNYLKDLACVDCISWAIEVLGWMH